MLMTVQSSLRKFRFRLGVRFCVFLCLCLQYSIMFSGRPAVRCPLTPFRRDAISLYLVDGYIHHVSGQCAKDFKVMGLKVRVAETYAGGGIQMAVRCRILSCS